MHLSFIKSFILQPSGIMLLVCLCISVCLLTTSAAPTPEALHFIGVGYNVIRGNPDGNFWARGGDDPGLFSTRKILSLTSSNTSVINEIVYEHHDTCRRAHEFAFFHDGPSYQAKLMERIRTSGINRLNPSVFTRFIPLFLLTAGVS